jgi:hypothetical protein
VQDLDALECEREREGERERKRTTKIKKVPGGPTLNTCTVCSGTKDSPFVVRQGLLFRPGQLTGLKQST